MKVKLIHCTPEAEKHIAYCARVSSPNQENPEISRLIKYLIKHKHWSPLEMGSLCLEIETTRAIAAQILRHKSLFFQEFSQRYQSVNAFESYDARSQDLKNKQNSIDNVSESDKDWFKDAQQKVWDHSHALYEEALSKGLAKEVARSLLPLTSYTFTVLSGLGFTISKSGQISLLS
jgi:thymidylate synthase (FAD)